MATTYEEYKAAGWEAIPSPTAGTDAEIGAAAERARLRPLLERCLLEAEATNGMILTDPDSGATRPVVNSTLLADLRCEVERED
jgi:hypothetical protein